MYTYTILNHTEKVHITPYWGIFALLFSATFIINSTANQISWREYFLLQGYRKQDQESIDLTNKKKQKKQKEAKEKRGKKKREKKEKSKEKKEFWNQ